jgi:glycerol-3-phosphate acyltransferase PlsY
MNIVLGGVLVAIIGYLFGSISFAVIVSKHFAKEDVRTRGSGNAGMTNVLRSYGKRPAFFTLIGDFSKGIAAIVQGRLLFSVMGWDANGSTPLIAGCLRSSPYLSVFFPVQGGKGVMTSAGNHPVHQPAGFLR